MNVHIGWKYALGSAAFIFLFLYLLVAVWINPLLEETARRSISLALGDDYQLHSIDVNLQLWNQDLKIQDAIISLDSSTKEQLLSSQVIGDDHFEVEIPFFEIKDLDYQKLFREKELHIGKLILQEPIIKWWDVSSDSDTTTKDTSQQIDFRALASSIDLFPLISKQLNKLKIEEVQFKHGALNYYQTASQEKNRILADDFSLLIKNFTIDSTNQPTSRNAYIADEVELDISLAGSKWMLPDSSYQIEISSFGISTLDQLMFAQDVSFVPVRIPDNIDSSSAISISIPSISLEGVTLSEILFGEKFEIDNFKLRQPSISLLKGENTTTPQNLDLPDPYDFIKGRYKALQIDTFSIENGSFVRKDHPDDITHSLFINHLNSSFRNIYIDSLSQYQKDKLFYTDDLDISLADAGLQLPNAGFIIKVDSLTFSRADQRLELAETWLIPTDHSKADVLEAHIPSLSVTGINLAQIWYERTIDLESLLLDQAEVSLTDYPSRRKDKLKAIATKDYEKLLNEAFKGFSAERISFQDAKFYLNDKKERPINAFTANDIDLDILALTLTPSMILGEKPLQVADVMLDFDLADSYITLPDSNYQISLDNIEFSSSKEFLEIDSLKVVPTLPSESDTVLYSLSLPKFRLQGFDFGEAYFDGNLTMDSLILSQPALAIDDFVDRPPSPLPRMSDVAFFPLIENYLDTLWIKHLDIQHAQISQTLHREEASTQQAFPDISLVMRHFYLDSTVTMGRDNILFAEDIDMHIRDYGINLPDSLNRLEMKDLHYSTGNEFFLVDSLSIHPYKELSEEDQRTDIDIPRLALQGINAFEILADKQAHLERLYLNSPHISLGLKADKHPLNDSLAPIQQLDLYPIIEPFVQDVRVDEILFHMGKLDLSSRDELFNPFHANNIYFSIQNFEVDSTSITNLQKPFFADTITLDVDIDPYAIYFPDKKYELTFRDVSLSTSDSTLKVAGIKLSPTEENTGSPVDMTLSLPALTLEGINFTEIYLDRLVNLKKVKMERPNIQLFQNENVQKATTASSNFSGIDQKKIIPSDPFPGIKDMLSAIAIQEWELSHGTFSLLSPTSRGIVVADFSLAADNFLLDANAYQKLEESYLFNEEVSLSVREFEIPLADDAMYRLKTQELGLSTSKGSLYIDSLQLIPKYSRRNFSIRTGVVTDRFELDVNRIEVSGFDFAAYLRTAAIKASSVHAVQPDFRVYKDMRWPFPVGKRPVLPQATLRKLTFPFHLDTMLVSDGSVLFEQRVAKTTNLARFSLTHMDADIFSLTNDPIFIAQGATTQLAANMYVMDKAKLAVNISMPLGDTSNYHTFKGVMGPMPADSLNPILEPIAFLTIKSGDIQKIDWDFEADNQSSSGKMRFHYNDLKVSLLNKKEGKKQGVAGFLGSSLANTFVVRRNNPTLRIMRVGRIEFEREINKAFIVYWIKSVVSGLQSSVGLHKKDEKFRILKDTDKQPGAI
ncbi:MAG: hypothetical protein AAF655_16445 [Bacteroidota bacterium]